MGPLGSGPHGGVAGPSGGVWAGIASDVGRSRRGRGVRRPPNRFPGGGVGKKSVCVAVRRHVAWINRLRIRWILSWHINASRPFSLAIRTSSTGHFAGEREKVLFVRRVLEFPAKSQVMETPYGIKEGASHGSGRAPSLGSSFVQESSSRLSQGAWPCGVTSAMTSDTWRGLSVGVGTWSACSR